MIQIELYYGRGRGAAAVISASGLSSAPSLCRGPFKLMKKTAEMTKSLKAIVLMLRLSYPIRSREIYLSYLSKDHPRRQLGQRP